MPALGDLSFDSTPNLEPGNSTSPWSSKGLSRLAAFAQSFDLGNWSLGVKNIDLSGLRGNWTFDLDVDGNWTAQPIVSTYQRALGWTLPGLTTEMTHRLEEPPEQTQIPEENSPARAQHATPQ